MSDLQTIVAFAVAIFGITAFGIIVWLDRR